MTPDTEHPALLPEHPALRFLRWLWRGAVSGLICFAVGAVAFSLMAIVLRVISDLMLILMLVIS